LIVLISQCPQNDEVVLLLSCASRSAPFTA